MAYESAFQRSLRQRREIWSHPSWWLLLITLPWVIGLVFLIHLSRRDAAVAARERTAWGTIIAHDPGNHNSYQYAFLVGGRLYRGWDTPQGAEPVLGQRVVIYYDSTDPNRNAFTDFADSSMEALGPAGMCLAGIIALALFIFYRRRAALSRPAE